MKYQHQKGSIYEKKGNCYPIRDKKVVVDVFFAVHSETLEEVEIFIDQEGNFWSREEEDYVLYFNIEHPQKIWARNFDMFYGLIEKDGEMVPRFKEMIDKI